MGSSGLVGRWKAIAVVVGLIGVWVASSKLFGYGGSSSSTWDKQKDPAVRWLTEMLDRLGVWAMPAYVGLHTLSLALCLPYAFFFEAGASLLFGFFPAVLCVFAAKVLGASLSFWIGRLVFRSCSSAIGWARRSEYFHLLSRGVERDGWRFVLLARFSPIPSYIINYGMAATNVKFAVDFLLPTVIGCLPMILQNASIGSLAGAAVASASGPQKSQIQSYIFPLIGLTSSILISLRIKKYSSDVSAAVSSPAEDVRDCNNTANSAQTSVGKRGEDVKKL